MHTTQLFSDWWHFTFLYVLKTVPFLISSPSAAAQGSPDVIDVSQVDCTPLGVYVPLLKVVISTSESGVEWDGLKHKCHLTKDQYESQDPEPALGMQDSDLLHIHTDIVITDSWG